MWRDHPKGREPRGMVPTLEVGITHTLEHMSESINNTELPQSCKAAAPYKSTILRDALTYTPNIPRDALTYTQAYEQNIPPTAGSADSGKFGPYRPPSPPATEGSAKQSIHLFASPASQ